MIKKIAIVMVTVMSLAGCQPLLSSRPSQPAPTPLVDSYTQARDRLYTHIELQVPKTSYRVTLTKAALRADYGDALKNPQGESGSVQLGDQVVEMNGSSFSTIAVNIEGSGELFYLAAFEPTQAGWTMSDSFELGERIRMQSMKLVNNHLVIQYVEHEPGQAMADAPTHEVMRSFDYLNHHLTEVK